MKTNVAVVIPNWNGEDFLGKCLESLINQSCSAEIIVVDNGSQDGSAELVKTKFPKVTLLEFPDNAGFAGGVNRGIKYALKKGVDYVALFNNDAVADKHWLSQLVEAAGEHPEAGIATGKLLRSDRKHIDSAGEQFTTSGLPFSRGRNEADKGQYDEAGFIPAASGGASLYRTAMLKKVGLFDEDFFAYLEDTDISFRAQLAGWKVYYQPKAVAYHEVGASSSKVVSRLGSFSRYHSIKNLILFYNRNMPGRLFWKYKVLLFVQLGRMLAGCLRDGELMAFIKALAVAAWRVPKTIAVRRANQSIRVVPIDYIDGLLYRGRPPRPPKMKGS